MGNAENKGPESLTGHDKIRRDPVRSLSSMSSYNKNKAAESTNNHHDLQMDKHHMSKEHEAVSTGGVNPTTIEGGITGDSHVHGDSRSDENGHTHTNFNDLKSTAIDECTKSGLASFDHNVGPCNDPLHKGTNSLSSPLVCPGGTAALFI